MIVTSKLPLFMFIWPEKEKSNELRINFFCNDCNLLFLHMYNSLIKRIYIILIKVDKNVLEPQIGMW